MLNDDQKLTAALQTYLEQSDGITVAMPSEVVRALLSRAESEAGVTPIDMVLVCPKCNTQHIDAPDEPGTAMAGIPRWTNPPHRSHKCHCCGHVWRPSDVETNGVAAVKTKGKSDSPIVASVAQAGTAVPASIWKTTHKAVCVPITEDKEIADQWIAIGYEVIAYSTCPAPQAVEPMTRQTLYDLIHGVLMEHGLSYTCDDSDEKYPLVDKLAAPGDSSTKTGRDEVALLAEAVLDVLPTTVRVLKSTADASPLVVSDEVLDKIRRLVSNYTNDEIRAQLDLARAPVETGDGAGNTVLANLVNAVRWWGSQEDGIPAEVTPAFNAAHLALGWSISHPMDFQSAQQQAAPRKLSRVEQRAASVVEDELLAAQPVAEDAHIVKLIREAGAGDAEWKALTRDVGPYELTEPTHFTRKFVQAAQFAQRAGVAESIAEGIEIIDCLIGSVRAHGNYSPESTVTFLNQVRQCFNSANFARVPAASAETDALVAASKPKAPEQVVNSVTVEKNAC